MTFAAVVCTLLAGWSAAQPPMAPPLPAPPPPGAAMAPPAQTPEILMQPRSGLPTPPPMGSNMPVLAEPVVAMPGDSVFMRRWIGAQPGLYFDVELSLLFVDLRSRGPGDGNFGQGNGFDLDATLAATFVVGWTFNNQNAMYFSYRGFGADGHPNSDDFFFDGVRTHFDLNELNWVYQHKFRLPGDRFRLAGEAGIRLADIYYDIGLHSQFPVIDDAFAPLAQLDFKASTEFVGAGPSLGFTGDYEILPGLSFIGRTDFAVLFGEQEDRVCVRTNYPGIDTIGSKTSEKHSNTVKVLRTMAGLNWAPLSAPRWTFQFGYQFEYWWDISKFDNVHDDLMLNGLFARMRFKY